MSKFQTLISTLQLSIFTWSYFCNFGKIKENSFKIKVQLNILNSLLGENNIEEKFLKIVKKYPETRNVLPILIATRKEKFKDFSILTDKKNLISEYQSELFDSKKDLEEEKILIFFKESWLKDLFENKWIWNLEDYVFWVETGLDSNARKNRTWDLMEDLVEEFVKDFCEKNNWFEYREQATANFIKSEWWIEVKSDKSSRRFDFAIFDKNKEKVYLIEVNYYWWGGSKLKAVAWEFAGLYDFMKKQNIPFYWITDWLGWHTASKSLEEAYNKMEGNIYNLEMLKEGILDKLIK